MISANTASWLTLLSTINLANAWTNPPARTGLTSQTLQEKKKLPLTHDVCTRSIDRLLLDNVNFNDVLNENSGNWTDSTFEFPAALFWEDMRVGPADD